MGRSATLARLALETSRSSSVIDEVLLGPLDFPTAAGYRRFLCMLYGFQAPLEAAVLLTPGLEPDIIERCKSARIANDLLSLGLTRHEFQLLTRRQTIGQFENAAQALGFMYASERLMLHVEALRVRLEVEMPVVIALANQFIYAYAGTADLRWRQFGISLDRVARVHGVDPIVAGARAGIESLQQWLAMHTELPAAVPARVSA